MAKRVKAVSLYQGLFLMAFGLYANEKLGQHSGAPAVPASPSVEPAPVADADPLRVLFQNLGQVPIFQGRVQGVTLERSQDEILIVLQSEELYRDQALEVEPVWYSSLDQIGREVYSQLDPNLEVEITGYGAKGPERAQWIYQYFRNQFQGVRGQKTKLFAVEQGKGDRIRFRVSKKTNK